MPAAHLTTRLYLGQGGDSGAGGCVWVGGVVWCLNSPREDESRKGVWRDAFTRSARMREERMGVLVRGMRDVLGEEGCESREECAGKDEGVEGKWGGLLRKPIFF